MYTIRGLGSPATLVNLLREYCGPADPAEPSQHDSSPPGDSSHVACCQIAALHGRDDVKAYASNPEAWLLVQAATTRAEACMFSSDFVQAVHWLRKLSAVQQRTLGTDHPQLLRTMHVIGTMLLLTDPPAAQAMLEAAVQARQRVLGMEHEDTLDSVDQYALVLLKLGQHAEAVSMLQRVLSVNQSTQGLNHPKTLQTMVLLAMCLTHQGQLEQAEPLLRQAAAGFQHADVENGIRVCALADHGSCLSALGRHEEAESVLRTAVALARKTEATLQREACTYRALGALALCRFHMGRHEQALPIFKLALDSSRLLEGKTAERTLDITGHYTSCLAKVGRFDEGLSLYETTLANLRSELGMRHALVAQWQKFRSDYAVCAAAHAQQRRASHAAGTHR